MPLGKRRTQRSIAAHREAEQTGVPYEEVLGRKEAEFRSYFERTMNESLEFEAERERALDRLESSISRREFFKAAGAVGGMVVGLTMVNTALPRSANAATAPRVVIVGGGVAGMTAAYKIYKSKGWFPQVYEAAPFIGGRVHTIRGKMQSGFHFDECASLIDSSHKEVLALIKELKLAKADLWKNYPDDPVTYHFNGAFVNEKTITDGFAKIDSYALKEWNKFKFVPGPGSPVNTTAQNWDNKTMAELATAAGYGPTTTVGRYWKTFQEADWSGPIDSMSALHGIVGAVGTGLFPAEYDDRWEVAGGNDKLVTTMESKLPAGTVRKNKKLIAIKKTNNTYTLTFQDSQGTALTTVVADRVVLAISPMAMQFVDYSQAGFSAQKVKCFAQPLGTNTKLSMQINGPWFTGPDSYSDNGTGVCWPVSHISNTKPYLIVYNNVDYGTLPPIENGLPSAVTNTVLAQLDQLHPTNKMSSKFIPGQAYGFMQTKNPYVGGSYSYYRPGDFYRYQGTQKAKEGTVHFAGEHTENVTNTGFINGAVISGTRVATELAAY